MAARGALVLNEVLPVELRDQLESDAQSQNATLNDVAGAILAKHYGIAWESSEKNYRPMADQFKLRVPEGLHLKLRVAAAVDPRTTVRGIVLNILSTYYGLETYAPTRRPRSVPS